MGCLDYSICCAVCYSETAEVDEGKGEMGAVYAEAAPRNS
jgi:hypothetical protein